MSNDESKVADQADKPRSPQGGDLERQAGKETRWHKVKRIIGSRSKNSNQATSPPTNFEHNIHVGWNPSRFGEPRHIGFNVNQGFEPEESEYDRISNFFTFDVNTSSVKDDTIDPADMLPVRGSGDKSADNSIGCCQQSVSPPSSNRNSHQAMSISEADSYEGTESDKTSNSLNTQERFGAFSKPQLTDICAPAMPYSKRKASVPLIGTCRRVTLLRSMTASSCESNYMNAIASLQDAIDSINQEVRNARSDVTLNTSTDSEAFHSK
jgi:hypothetical protein